MPTRIIMAEGYDTTTYVGTGTAFIRDSGTSDEAFITGFNGVGKAAPGREQRMSTDYLRVYESSVRDSGVSPGQLGGWAIVRMDFRTPSNSVDPAVNTLLRVADRSDYSPGNSGYGGQFTLIINDSGHLNTSGAASGGGALAEISRGSWYSLEMQVQIQGSGAQGGWKVRLNDSNDLSWSGTRQLPGTVGSYQHRLYEMNAYSLAGTGSAVSDAGYIDNIVFAESFDADPQWLGRQQVRHYAPTSTSVGQWAGSDGDQIDNHLLVNDPNDLDTSYVSSTASSDQYDLYGHDAIDPAHAIRAVQLRGRASVDSPGTDDFSLVVRSGASEELYRKTLGFGARSWHISTMLSNDPATGVGWANAGFDAATFGFKS